MSTVCKRDLKKTLTEIVLCPKEVNEIIGRIGMEVDDFSVGVYRCISISEIDRVLANELSEDPYFLGCFRADFISRYTQIPQEMIEACQEVNAYEAIGKGVIATCGLMKLVKAYVEEDGYGHYFATYDGECHHVGQYNLFRIN